MHQQPVYKEPVTVSNPLFEEGAEDGSWGGIGGDQGLVDGVWKVDGLPAMASNALYGTQSRDGSSPGCRGSANQ